MVELENIPKFGLFLFLQDNSVAVQKSSVIDSSYLESVNFVDEFIVNWPQKGVTRKANATKRHAVRILLLSDDELYLRQMAKDYSTGKIKEENLALLRAAPEEACGSEEQGERRSNRTKEVPLKLRCNHTEVPPVVKKRGRKSAHQKKLDQETLALILTETKLNLEEEQDSRENVPPAGDVLSTGETVRQVAVSSKGEGVDGQEMSPLAANSANRFHFEKEQASREIVPPAGDVLITGETVRQVAASSKVEVEERSSLPASSVKQSSSESLLSPIQPGSSRKRLNIDQQEGGVTPSKLPKSVTPSKLPKSVTPSKVPKSVTSARKSLEMGKLGETESNELKIERLEKELQFHKDLLEVRNLVATIKYLEEKKRELSSDEYSTVTHHSSCSKPKRNPPASTSGTLSHASHTSSSRSKNETQSSFEEDYEEISWADDGDAGPPRDGGVENELLARKEGDEGERVLGDDTDESAKSASGNVEAKEKFTISKDLTDTIPKDYKLSLFVNKLLEKLYSLEYLATHTMTDKAASVGAGGKKAMEVNELVEIIRVTQQRFLPKAESRSLLAVKLAQQEVLIRRSIKNKLGNAAAKFKKN